MNQTVTINSDSPIGTGLLKSEWFGGKKVALVIKDLETGEALYRGLIVKWRTTGNAGETRPVEVDLEDWNEYFGQVAARHHFV